MNNFSYMQEKEKKKKRFQYNGHYTTNWKKHVSDGHAKAKWI